MLLYPVRAQSSVGGPRPFPRDGSLGCSSRPGSLHTSQNSLVVSSLRFHSGRSPLGIHTRVLQNPFPWHWPWGKRNSLLPTGHIMEGGTPRHRWCHGQHPISFSPPGWCPSKWNNQIVFSLCLVALLQPFLNFFWFSRSHTEGIHLREGQRFH